MSMSIVLPRAQPRVGTLAVLVADRDGGNGFAARDYCRLLCEAGSRLGLDVIVVTPSSLLAAGTPYGFRPDPDAAAVPTGGGWRREAAPVPGLVYDRHFAASRRELQRYRAALQQLRGQPGVRLLGSGLPGKLAVQRLLRRDAELAPHLPETALLRTERGLLAALASRGELFLKPDGGSQGRGAMRVRREPDSGAVSVHGRTPGNAPFSRRFADGSSFAKWLLRAAHRRPYLVQPYLTLQDRSGASYDIRCLMQKNGRGLWQLTGMAVRRGRLGSVTANLHGGGSALPVEPFLTGEFGPEAGAAMTTAIKRLASRVPETLEAQHGRLVELGIDFGVDRDGRIWLIEVNSKPGRAAFAHIGSPETRRTAVESPLRYARFMIKTPTEVISGKGGRSNFAHTKFPGGPTP